jgi:cell division protein FtsL
MDDESRSVFEEIDTFLKSIRFILVVVVLAIVGFALLATLGILQVHDEIKQLREAIRAQQPGLRL